MVSQGGMKAGKVSLGVIMSGLGVCLAEMSCLYLKLEVISQLATLKYKRARYFGSSANADLIVEKLLQTA